MTNGFAIASPDLQFHEIVEGGKYSLTGICLIDKNRRVQDYMYKFNNLGYFNPRQGDGLRRLAIFSFSGNSLTDSGGGVASVLNLFLNAYVFTFGVCSIPLFIKFLRRRVFSKKYR